MQTNSVTLTRSLQTNRSTTTWQRFSFSGLAVVDHGCVSYTVRGKSLKQIPLKFMFNKYEMKVFLTV